MVRLKKRLRLDVEYLLPFWFKVDDIKGDGALLQLLIYLYEKLFRNRTVLIQPDQGFPQNPLDLIGNPGVLSEHAATIASALGISTEDFGLLTEDRRVIPEEGQDVLDPSNLLRLYQHAILAKGLKIKVRDYLSILALWEKSPFEEPIETLLFVEDVELIRNSGFSLTKLDYLLLHRDEAVEELSPIEATIASVLEDIRSGLQTIADENTFRDEPNDPFGRTIDEKGDLTRQKLCLLEWDTDQTDSVINTLNNTFVYSASLGDDTDVPPFPEDLKHKIVFEESENRLTFKGVMSISEQNWLHELPGSSIFHDAIDTLFNAPRLFLRRNLQTYSVRDFSAAVGE